jgi:hypothetical protein
MSPICARKLLRIRARDNATEKSLGILQASRKFISGLKELPPVGLQSGILSLRCQICSGLAQAPPSSCSVQLTYLPTKLTQRGPSSVIVGRENFEFKRDAALRKLAVRHGGERAGTEHTFGKVVILN